MAAAFFASRAGYANAVAGDYLTRDYHGGVRRGSTTSSNNSANAERRDSATPKPVATEQLSEDDIIIITVRITTKDRRASFDDPLPERPAPRSFIRRLSTRITTPPDATKYKAVKMPRGEYLRHFRHDGEGRYVGTEPQREWTEEEVEERYGKYQEMRLTNSFRGTAIGATTAGAGMVGVRPGS